MALYIYHPPTRTYIPVDDSVFLIDSNELPETAHKAILAGIVVPERIHHGINLGIAIDNLRKPFFPMMR